MYGHPGRAKGVKESTGDFVLITNDDNYYAPTFVERFHSLVLTSSPDTAIFNFANAHNYFNHISFATIYHYGYIDMGSGIVAGDLSRSVGFPFRASAGDWEYFSTARDWLDNPLLEMTQGLQTSILFAHN